MRRLGPCLLACGLAALVAVPARAAEPPRDADFARLHALIKPTPREDAWTQVAWRTDLWQARKEAAARGKPILLWEMDGHPLGCT
jgi:hypothetical protein